MSQQYADIAPELRAAGVPADTVPMFGDTYLYKGERHKVLGICKQLADWSFSFQFACRNRRDQSTLLWSGGNMEPPHDIEHCTLIARLGVEVRE